MLGGGGRWEFLFIGDVDEVERGAEAASFAGGVLAVDHGSWVVLVILVGLGVAAGVEHLVVLGAGWRLVADAEGHGS